MVAWPDRRFIDLVGCEHPIIQAPMANVGGVDLCVAASRAGALGSLPCGMITPERAREQVSDVREKVDGPINLNFFCFEMPAPSTIGNGGRSSHLIMSSSRSGSPKRRRFGFRSMRAIAP
jgi:NAD(P)H-dependent flavin oxidoreductase YrpB (nitropropane dioxygenase family)